LKSVAKPSSTLKSLLRFLPLLFPLVAQAAGTVAPGAGTILQQVKPVEPPAPSSNGTGLKIEQGEGAKLPPSAPFLVNTIRITGNSLFATATLHALVMDAEGQSLTLTKLNELAARITDYYHAHGYPLARAIIPAQTIRDGMVEIEVIEARYGKIKLDNHSQVGDSLLGATLSPLQSGQAIEQSALDHSLLLLADIPGIVNSATLRPGDMVGTSDLLVETAPGLAVTGNVVLDDYGNNYTGKTRAGGTVNFIDPLHYGDVLSASGMSSGSGMSYGRLNYESVLNGRGTRMGGSYSAMHYILGDTLASLNGHGTAQIASLWMKHPLVRSRNSNLYGQIQYDQKQLRDHIDVIVIRTDRHLENWTASLSGDMRDTFLSGSINTGSLGWTSGLVGFDDGEAQLADFVTAKTQGRFSKWNAAFSSLQALSTKTELYISFLGQWANTNLDSAEKMVAGGSSTVRAYDSGVVSGDVGYLGTAEFRQVIGQDGKGRWQAIAFVDSEHIKVNKNPWSNGVNSTTLSGGGLGLAWLGSNQWSAKAYVGKPIGSTPSLVGTNRPSIRSWIEIGMGF
jgi:hemolysin activation/secretion protein